MKNEKYSILTNENSLHLMCVNACPECSLIKMFKDIENVSLSATYTPENVLVLGLSLMGVDKEKQSLLPTLRELTQQVCDTCQRNR